MQEQQVIVFAPVLKNQHWEEIYKQQNFSDLMTWQTSIAILRPEPYDDPWAAWRKSPVHGAEVQCSGRS